jgi:hypothetical protein
MMSVLDRVTDDLGSDLFHVYSALIIHRDPQREAL